MSYLNVVGKSSHSEQIKSLATFQSCVFVTFQLYSSTEIIIGKDTKLSFFLNKKIKNYHIWSTEIFINKDTKLIFLYSLNICFFCRSAGLSSESPQVSYVKVSFFEKGKKSKEERFFPIRCFIKTEPTNCSEIKQVFTGA